MGDEGLSYDCLAYREHGACNCSTGMLGKCTASGDPTEPTLDAAVEAVAVALALELGHTMADCRPGHFRAGPNTRRMAEEILAASGLLATLAAERVEGERLREAFYLTPCHVTGEHTPDHHLTREAPCSFQLAELAERIVKVLGGPPHRDHAGCVWCSEYDKGWPPSPTEEA